MLIEKILPDEVASAEAFGDPPDAVLYPGEAELISRAVDKRRREFRTVRHCARQALGQLGQLAAADSATCWDRILFCAKEAVYKAWFPLTHRWLGFEDAAVTIEAGPIEAGPAEAAEGSFSARLLVAAPTITGDPLTHLTGRWLRHNDLVITTMVVLSSTDRS